MARSSRSSNLSGCYPRRRCGVPVDPGLLGDLVLGDDPVLGLEVADHLANCREAAVCSYPLCDGTGDPLAHR